MTTIYPAGIDNSGTLPVVIDGVTAVNAALLNGLTGAIIAIEQALGVNPAGTYTTVVARLNAIGSGGGGGGPAGPAGGDLTGAFPNPIVIALQGRSVSSVAPSVGQALTWDGVAWIPETIMTGGFTASGDLSGTSTNQTVVGLRGRAISLTAPTDGQLLVWSTSGNNWVPGALNLAGGSTNVIGALPISNLAPGTSAQVLMSNGTPATVWTTISGDIAISSSGSTSVSTISGSGGKVAFNATIVGDSGTSSPINWGVSAISMSSDANLTLSTSQFTNPILRITSSVPLTSTRSIILPSVTGAKFDVYNGTSGGQSLLFIASTGSGLTVPNGLKTTIYFDGTNYVTSDIVVGGDLSATTNIAQTVVKIQGNPVLAQSLGAAQDGYVLTWSNSASQNQWLPGGGGGVGALFGDVTGSSSANSISKIQGVTVASPSSLNDGYALVTNSSGVYVPTGIAPVFNVKNFGAIGNGVADDTNAINTAITVSNGNGVVYFPAGNYLISNELQITISGTKLQGESSAYATNMSTITTNSFIRSILSVGGAFCKINGLKLNANLKALYGLYRQSDGFTHYEDVYCIDGILDGMHAASVQDGYVISAVSETGTSPLISITGIPYNGYSGASAAQVLIASTGTVGTATVQFSLNNGTSYSAAIPITSKMDIPNPVASGSSWSGLIANFPAGTYNSGDFYTFTVTITPTNNDSSVFDRCWATNNGTAYATSSIIGNFSQCRTSSVSGTVSITASSQTVQGSGTSFSTTNARPGDFFVPFIVESDGAMSGSSALLTCATSTPFSSGMVGMLISVGNAGPSGGTLVAAIASYISSSQVTLSVAATGGVSSKTVNIWYPYQILNINSDGYLTTSARNLPLFTASGLNYAICVGSGFYEEVHNDNNIVTIEGGLWRDNAASGICCNGLYGPYLEKPQADSNGVCGISVGLDNNDATVIGTVIVRPYFEGEGSCGLFVGSCSGIDLLRPNTDGIVPVFIVSNGFSEGIATTTNGQIPIGNNTYSTVPVTTSVGNGSIWTEAGLVVRKRNLQEPLASQAINPLITSFVSLDFASTTTFTSTPTITTTGAIDSMELDIFNEGFGTAVFQDNTLLIGSQLVLSSGNTFALEFGQSTKFRFYNNKWYQVYPTISNLTTTTNITSSYNAKISDYLIAVGTTSSSPTITLLASPTAGLTHVIKDAVGGAATHPITISGNGNNIDGASTMTLYTNYSSVELIFTGTTWSVV